jgi:hypothetical protein
MIDRDTVYGLVGRFYQFDDGDRIDVIQVKERNIEEQLITVHLKQGPGIPRKLVLSPLQFIDMYGHLFGLVEDIPKEE